MNIDLSKIKHVHFVGIGGIGVSAIARMMLGEGKVVSGQDTGEGEIIDRLKKLGIDVVHGQSFENIPKDADLIVYTIAIEYYDPEFFNKLKECSTPALSYPQMLGVISAGKYTISVSGTHGKTTTTGMISQILRDLGKDPTVVIGSLLADGTNFVHGGSDLFVVESCEYRRSFLNINPNILVITNVDADHLDYYKDIEDIKSAFRELAMKIPSDGFIVCDPDDANVADVVAGVKAKIVNYQKFFDPELKLKVPGIHNKKDAACALAVADILGIPNMDAIGAVCTFPGTWRRFQYKGELYGGAKVYDDYAHHPAEIKATLQGFREFYPKDKGYKITVVFQPHLFSRTKSLIREFPAGFSDADLVLLLPIYPAREVDDGTMSSEILAGEINKYENNTLAFADFTTAENHLKDIDFTDRDIIVSMGAGEAFKVVDKLLS